MAITFLPAFSLRRKASSVSTSGFAAAGTGAAAATGSCSGSASHRAEPEHPEEEALTPILEIQKLSHIYSPDTPFEHAALTNVDLTISRGEFVGLIGHTGSGKSTLVQHLNGLIKATSGPLQDILVQERFAAEKRNRDILPATPREEPVNRPLRSLPRHRRCLRHYRRHRRP